MKQWKIEIEPKCEGGGQLFVNSRGKVRPCFWINERSDEKNVFDQNPNWDLKETPLNDIIDVHLKKFTDDIKKNPFNALKVCFYECSQKRVP